MNTSTAKILLACLLWVPMLASAGIQVGSTRVVYPMQSREVAVSLLNIGTTPSLVQAWIDDGDPKSRPNDLDGIPFVITPPITRIDGGMGQTLRLSYLGGNAPQDRESLYWINILDIPASSAGASEPRDDGRISAHLQFSVRNRLKVFLRPKGLPGSANAAVEALSWQPSTHEGKPSLLATNPTPYFVSVAFLTVPGEGRVEANLVVPPKGTAHVPLKQPVAPSAQFVVRSINDYGGTVDTKVNLGRITKSDNAAAP